VPRPNLTDWPSPIKTKTILRFGPGKKVLLIRPTINKRQKDAEMPFNARNIISYVLVLERPHANVKIACNRQPVRYIRRPLTISEIDPHNSKIQSHVKTKIKTGPLLI